MDEIKTLTRDDVIERLKNMKVGENDIKPVHIFSFLVLNPDYDPESFSQEIEDSEREVTLTELAEFLKRDDWWYTPCDFKCNSEKWRKNHSKICPIKFLPSEIWGVSVCYRIDDSVVRDYYDEALVDRIMKIDNIVDFC